MCFISCWNFLFLFFSFLCSSPHTVQLSTFAFSFCGVAYGSDMCITGRALGKTSSNLSPSKKLGIYHILKSRKKKYTTPQIISYTNRLTQPLIVWRFFLLPEEGTIIHQICVRLWLRHSHPIQAKREYLKFKLYRSGILIWLFLSYNL